MTVMPRILLVEDDLITQVAIQHLLKNSGCAVVVAGTGQEAFAALQTAFDLILLDFGLPDIRGFEVAQRIRAVEGPNQHIPIIGLTALNDESYLQRAADAGMNAVKIKPLTQAVWYELMTRHLSR